MNIQIEIKFITTQSFDCVQRTSFWRFMPTIVAKVLAIRHPNTKAMREYVQ